MCIFVTNYKLKLNIFENQTMKKNSLIIFTLFIFAHLASTAQIANEIVFTSEPENLGENVNSELIDAEPKITPDGKRLYFCRRKDPNNIGGADTGADIWYSDLQNDGTWGKAKNLGEPVNNKSFNQVIGIRSDGNAMIVRGKYDKPANIYITKKTGGKWSKPKPMEIDGFYLNNLGITYGISVDFKVLVISADWENSIGREDLYISFRKEDYGWTKPIHTGDVINSKDKEIYPVLANDGVTMYFASRGHEGYGNYDIFVSRRLDDTWTNWSKPKNMGNKINTPKFDSDFTVDSKSEYAYISSDKIPGREFDIFRIKLPKEAKPNPVVIVTGKVMNQKDEKPIVATVTYQNMTTGKSLGSIVSDPEDGSYKIVLPYGKKYSFSAKADGFVAVSNNLDLSDVEEFKEMNINLVMIPLKAGETVRINNLFFETGSANLNPDSYTELNNLVQLLNDNPQMTIEIAGHTDSAGGEETNMKLSQERAKSVEKYLIEKGIEPNRLKSVGYGETKPVTSNKTEKGKQLNRRVEFKIIKN